MNKNKNNNRNKPAKGRKNNRIKIRSYPLLKHALNTKINFQLPVYAINYASISNTYYSLVNTYVTSPTLSMDIMSLFLATPEFSRLKVLYGFVRIKGITLRAMSSTNQSSVIADLPSLYLDLMLGSTLIITNPNNALAADSAFEVKPNNSGAGHNERHYHSQGVVTGLNGYPCLGSDLYFATTSITNTAQVDIVLGYGFAPTFTNSVNSINRVMCIDVIFDTEFCQPLYQLN
jgi:hypothetical protein